MKKIKQLFATVQLIVILLGLQVLVQGGNSNIKYSFIAIIVVLGIISYAQLSKIAAMMHLKVEEIQKSYLNKEEELRKIIKDNHKIMTEFLEENHKGYVENLSLLERNMMNSLNVIDGKTNERFERTYSLVNRTSGSIEELNGDVHNKFEKLDLVLSNLNKNLTDAYRNKTDELERNITNKIENHDRRIYEELKTTSSSIKERLSQVDDKHSRDFVNLNNKIDVSIDEFHSAKKNSEKRMDSIDSVLSSINDSCIEMNNDITNKDIRDLILFNEKNKEDVFESIINDNTEKLDTIYTYLESINKTIDVKFDDYRYEIETIIKKYANPVLNIDNSDIKSGGISNKVEETDKIKVIKENGKIKSYLDKEKRQETNFEYSGDTLIKSILFDSVTKIKINEFMYNQQGNIVESYDYINGIKTIKTVYENNEISKKINLISNKENKY